MGYVSSGGKVGLLLQIVGFLRTAGWDSSDMQKVFSNKSHFQKSPRQTKVVNIFSTKLSPNPHARGSHSNV